MSRRLVDLELQRHKRQLRRRIASSRRRIDRRLHRVGSEGRRLASWRIWVSRYPTAAVLGAFGLGLTLSAGLGRRRLAGWLGRLLLRRAGKGIEEVVWRELAAIWRRSAPAGKAGPEGSATGPTGACSPHTAPSPPETGGGGPAPSDSLQEDRQS